ncbi:MAG: hypothetical protein PHR20_02725 [Bacteroidales bacterium]|nr:hypothetical protein [Bacteroidales bacterium]
MKKLFCAILFLGLGIISVFAAGDEPFFPVREGAVLTYADKNPKGKVLSYVVYTIEKVETAGDVISITYQIESLDDNKKLAFPPFYTTIKIEDGYVHFDATSCVANLVEGMEVTGRGIILPSNMKAGDVLDDYKIIITNLGMESVCSNINVSTLESITTDAGTFDCFKVDSSVATKVLFINTSGTTSVWYAHGIGDVKTNTYDKKGKLIQTRELVSLK